MSYREPTDDFDATSEKELNTFLSISNETFYKDIKECIQFCGKIEGVSKAVQADWADSLAQGNEAARERTQMFLRRLSDLIFEKIDYSTSYLLRFIDNSLNDRLEFQV